MRKIAAFLLCLCLLSAGCVTAFAQTVTQDETGGSAEISVKVPDSHTLTVRAEHAQVLYSGQWDESFSVERLSEPQLLIRPEDGYKVKKVTLNGEDVTEAVIGGYYTLGPVYEEKEMVVKAEAVTTDSDGIHDISGTVVDEDGNPIPGATVDIGGKTDVTDEDGNFTIEDVPDGRHPVTITDEDGNIIGYTEIEIGQGEPGITPNPDGSYTLTTPENADLDLDLTVTADGKVSVDKPTDTTPEQPDQPDEPSGPSEPGRPNEPGSSGASPQTGDGSKSPQTGDDSNIIMWVTLLSFSAAWLAFLAVRRRKHTKEDQ